MPKLDVKQWVDESAEAYGNKAANLMVMEKGFADINIPDICPLSHMMCLKHLDTHYPEWRTQWEAFKEKQGNESGGLAEGTHEILSQLRSGIEQAFGEYPLEDEGISEYLASHFEPGEVLMVRSTGKEDSAELANPGGNESYAGISANIDSVSAACGRVIASYFSEKSLEQRLKAKHAESDSIMGEPFMPVLLQKMIGEVIVADKITPTKKVYSGVMYVNQDGKVTIQEAPGHGELVVNSKGPINSYFILGEGTVHQQVNEKPFRMVSYINEAGKAELIVQKNTNEIKNSSLPKEVVERLGKMGKEIQAFYGDDRDIEFVYDENADKIYIVQARPIPLGESARHIPSAISPEKIREVKKEVPYYKAKTIAVAASKVEVAENAGDVIICNTIGDALTMYLDMKDPKIKAVVVARDAPSTSHEAAEFNSVSIPVFYVDKAQKDKIQSSLEQGNKQFLFDPQRGLIVDWSGKGNPEEILKEGLFKSSISAERTLLPESKMLFSENSILQAEKLLQGAKKKKGMSYEQLLDQLEIVESTTPQTIIQSREALKQVLMDIIDTCRVAHVNDTQIDKDLKSNILKHAIAYSLDVDTLLTKIESQQGNVIDDKDQKQLLDLINGLEALIANPGRTGLYSDSVYNLMQDFALKSRLNKSYPIYTRLPEENRKVVEAIALFGKNAVNDKLRDKWERFVIQVAVTDRGSQEKNLEKLASVVYFAQANDLGSVLINNVFSQLDTSDFSKTIEVLNEQTEHLKPYADKIFRLEVKAAELEAKAVLWGKKRNHTKLIKEYEKDVAEVLACIDSLAPVHDLPLMAKHKVLNEVARITEIVDVSIKIMKGSQDYPKEDSQEKDEQAKLFFKMLLPYHELMQKVVYNMEYTEKTKNFNSALSGAVSYGGSSGRSPDKTPEDRCKLIKERFDSVDSNKITREQLFSSNEFDVGRATIQSSDVFELQFTNKKMNLEDYYTLFHQNILVAISNMQSSRLPENHYPEKLRNIVKALRGKMGEADVHDDYARLYSAKSTVSNGILYAVYNIPLGQHGAKVSLAFDLKTSYLSIDFSVHGHNADGRMDRARDFISNFPKAIGLNISEIDTSSFQEGTLPVMVPYMVKSICNLAYSNNPLSVNDFLFDAPEDLNLMKTNAALHLMARGYCDMLLFFNYISNPTYNVNSEQLLAEIEEYNVTLDKRIRNGGRNAKEIIINTIENAYESLMGHHLSCSEVIQSIKNQEFRDALTFYFYKNRLSYDNENFEKIFYMDKFLQPLIEASILNSDYVTLERILKERTLDSKHLSDVLAKLMSNPENMSDAKLACVKRLGEMRVIPDFSNLGHNSELLFNNLSYLLESYDVIGTDEFIKKSSESDEADFDKMVVMRLYENGKLKLDQTSYDADFIYSNFKSIYTEIVDAIKADDIEAIKNMANPLVTRMIVARIDDLLKYTVDNKKYRAGAEILNVIKDETYDEEKLKGLFVQFFYELIDKDHPTNIEKSIFIEKFITLLSFTPNPSDILQAILSGRFLYTQPLMEVILNNLRNNQYLLKSCAAMFIDAAVRNDDSETFRLFLNEFDDNEKNMHVRSILQKFMYGDISAGDEVLNYIFEKSSIRELESIIRAIIDRNDVAKLNRFLSHIKTLEEMRIDGMTVL
jgi:hypothetical protein